MVSTSTNDKSQLKDDKAKKSGRRKSKAGSSPLKMDELVTSAAEVFRLKSVEEIIALEHKKAKAETQAAADTHWALFQKTKEVNPLFDAAWRKTTLVNVFGDDAGPIAKAFKAKTMGELYDKGSEHDWAFATIEGFGTAGFNRVNDKLDKFWKRNPDWTEPSIPMEESQ